MDNFDGGDFSSEEKDKPILFDDGLDDKPVPFDDVDGKDVPKIELGRPIAKKVSGKKTSSDQIAGVKTFFTKLHVGAIGFLDEQINSWLGNNPDVKIKRTNATTGIVQGKKNEPNIIITVWY